MSTPVGIRSARAERIREILEELVRQRQTLPKMSGERGAREANRRSIVYWQGELANALIEEHRSLDAS